MLFHSMQPDLNTWEVGRTLSSCMSWLPYATLVFSQLHTCLDRLCEMEKPFIILNYKLTNEMYFHRLTISGWNNLSSVLKLRCLFFAVLPLVSCLTMDWIAPASGSLPSLCFLCLDMVHTVCPCGSCTSYCYFAFLDSIQHTGRSITQECCSYHGHMMSANL